jgi:chemotaxis protein histidine kinase CheA
MKKQDKIKGIENLINQTVELSLEFPDDSAIEESLKCLKSELAALTETDEEKLQKIIVKLQQEVFELRMEVIALKSERFQRTIPYNEPIITDYNTTTWVL